MKKLSILGSALLALAFTSCDDTPGLGIPQTNPQEAIMSVDGVTVAFGDALAGEPAAISLDEYQTTDEIQVIKVAETKDLPAGATVEFQMQLATQADYSDAITMNVTNGCVSAEAWDAYFRDKLGKHPEAKENFVRFAAYVSENGQLSRLGTPDTWLAAKAVSVTPVPINVSEKYYLVGSINSWDPTTAIEFNHSDKSVYDDPVFTTIVEISDAQAADGWLWKILPTQGAWDGQLGTVTDGDSELSGKLTDINPGAGCIKQAGKFLISINVLDMTYKFQEIKSLYTPGESNNWSPATSQQLTFNADKGYFTGFAYLKGEFKFTSEPSWEGTNYGDGGEGKISDQGGNLRVANEGLYFVKVNISDLTYELTPITSWGMIGGFNGWGGDEPLTAVADTDMLVWQGTLTLTDASEWKFRANADWGVNLGGEMSDLTVDGSNLNSAAGTYTVKLDLRQVPYTCTVTPASRLRRK